MENDLITRLLQQIAVARTELNNLRRQISDLKFRYENDVDRLSIAISNISSINSNTAVLHGYVTAKPKSSREPWQPIGYIRSAFPSKSGTPRQGTLCATTAAELAISKHVFTNPAHALEGLEQFSHVWLLYLFHRNENRSTDNDCKAKVSPPRLDGSKVGVFGTRSPHRPNPIGLTLATIVSIKGDTLHLQGVDAVDGTPILDIKPYIPTYDCPQQINLTNSEQVQVPEWIKQTTSQRLSVNFTATALEQLNTIVAEGFQLKRFPNAVEARDSLSAVLAEDPRTLHRRHSRPEDLYYFHVDGVRVTCWFDKDTVLVLKVKPDT